MMPRSDMNVSERNMKSGYEKIKDKIIKYMNIDENEYENFKKTEYEELCQKADREAEQESNSRARIEIECRKCHNRDPAQFVMNYVTGDYVCKCGTVAVGNYTVEDKGYRHFDDSKDMDENGEAIDPFITTTTNLALHSKKGMNNVVKAENDKMTSDIFKDKKKKEADQVKKIENFFNLEKLYICDTLSIPDYIRFKAYHYYCAIRDYRQKVHKEKFVLCFCLCYACKNSSDICESVVETHTFKCNLCNKKFPDRNTMRFHICQKDTKNKSSDESQKQYNQNEVTAHKNRRESRILKFMTQQQ